MIWGYHYFRNHPNLLLAFKRGKKIHPTPEAGTISYWLLLRPRVLGSQCTFHGKQCCCHGAMLLVLIFLDGCFFFWGENHHQPAGKSCCTFCFVLCFFVCGVFFFFRPILTKKRRTREAPFFSTKKTLRPTVQNLKLQLRKQKKHTSFQLVFYHRVSSWILPVPAGRV